MKTLAAEEVRNPITVKMFCPGETMKATKAPILGGRAIQPFSLDLSRCSALGENPRRHRHRLCLVLWCVSE